MEHSFELKKETTSGICSRADAIISAPFRSLLQVLGLRKAKISVFDSISELSSAGAVKKGSDMEPTTCFEKGYT